MGQESETRSQVLGGSWEGDLGASAKQGREEGSLGCREPEAAWASGGAKACREREQPGRGVCMCVVGERHLNIVGMKDKFKIHQAELRQDDNVRNMNHSF